MTFGKKLMGCLSKVYKNSLFLACNSVYPGNETMQDRAVIIMEH